MSKSIINLFLIVIIVGIYIFVIYPLQKGGGSVFGLTKSISELTTLNNDLTNNQEQSRKLTDKAGQYKSAYETLTTPDQFNRPSVEEDLISMIPKSVDPVRLEEEVVRILGEKGFAVDNISYSLNPQNANNNYGVYTINFSTKGDYKRFKDVIHSFEISKRIYVIKSIQLKSSSALDGGDNNMQFQLRLETYYMN
jgi:hypothetical protein